MIKELKIFTEYDQKVIIRFDSNDVVARLWVKEIGDNGPLEEGKDLLLKKADIQEMIKALQDIERTL